MNIEHSFQKPFAELTDDEANAVMAHREQKIRKSEKISEKLMKTLKKKQ